LVASSTCNTKIVPDVNIVNALLRVKRIISYHPGPFFSSLRAQSQLSFRWAEIHPLPIMAFQAPALPVSGDTIPNVEMENRG
jgi:hypothetical protein